MTSPITRHDLTPSIETTFQQLAELSVSMEDCDAVREYLEAHSDLIASMVPVASLARTRFPPSARITLELYVDPEIDDRYLAILVRLKEYPSGALQQIREARRLARPYVSGRSGRLLLTSDYQPAR